jgi:hypothetical protein
VSPVKPLAASLSSSTRQQLDRSQRAQLTKPAPRQQKDATEPHRSPRHRRGQHKHPAHSARPPRFIVARDHDAGRDAHRAVVPRAALDRALSRARGLDAAAGLRHPVRGRGRHVRARHPGRRDPVRAPHGRAALRARAARQASDAPGRRPAWKSSSGAELTATDRRRGGSQNSPHRSWRWRRTVHW